MAPYAIRLIGDPVLRRRASDVTDIDGGVARLVDDMFTTMYEAPGLGLAAPQVGVSKRIFVYDHDDRPGVLINPEVAESDGEWVYPEGCLSVPGLHWDIVRPKQVLIRGLDLNGNEVSIEADELEARVFLHELDHLDGILLIERLEADERKAAKRALRELALGSDVEPSSLGGALGVPGGAAASTGSSASPGLSLP
ncbi:MAG: peptide deformylase [Acidimicrobiia bacterium]|nr:peptide deformylase [Acidimicrobiia bacterium]